MIPREPNAAKSSSVRRQLVIAVGWHAALLLAWSGYVYALLPFWGFGVLGVCAFIRSFNALHLLSHRCAWSARSWRQRVPMWLLAPVSGPLAVGWPELTRVHREHHRLGNTDQDPDAYLSRGPAWRAAFGSLTQPEQGLVRYFARYGGVAAFVTRVLGNISFLSFALWMGGVRGLVAWLAVTRIGTAAAWFVFDWVLHHPWSWEANGGLSVPRIVSVPWRIAFGGENLNAIRFHRAHHEWPGVPDGELPRVASERVHDEEAFDAT